MTLSSDVEKLQRDVERLTTMVETNTQRSITIEQQIGGERGIDNVLNGLADEIKSLRRAAYWVAGLIIASSIAFGFSALTVLHP